MAFMVTAQFTKENTTIGKVWWVCTSNLTQHSLLKTVDEAKIEFKLDKIVPVYIYDFGEEKDDEKDN